jgi:hypothetical protein
MPADNGMMADLEHQLASWEASAAEPARIPKRWPRSAHHQRNNLLPPTPRAMAIWQPRLGNAAHWLRSAIVGTAMLGQKKSRQGRLSIRDGP